MKSLIIGLLLASSALFVTGCGSECEGLTASDRDRQAAADGYEVEKEGNFGGTCELQNDGTWKVDD